MLTALNDQGELWVRAQGGYRVGARKRFSPRGIGVLLIMLMPCITQNRGALARTISGSEGVKGLIRADKVSEEGITHKVEFVDRKGKTWKVIPEREGRILFLPRNRKFVGIMETTGKEPPQSHAKVFRYIDSSGIVLWTAKLWSGGGHVIISDNGSTIVLTDLGEGEVIENYNSIVVGPPGNKGLRIFSADGKLLHSEKYSPREGVYFSPNGRFIMYKYSSGKFEHRLSDGKYIPYDAQGEGWRLFDVKNIMTYEFDGLINPFIPDNDGIVRFSGTIEGVPGDTGFVPGKGIQHFPQQ